MGRKWSRLPNLVAYLAGHVVGRTVQLRPASLRASIPWDKRGHVFETAQLCRAKRDQIRKRCLYSGLDGGPVCFQCCWVRTIVAFLRHTIRKGEVPWVTAN